MRVMQQPHDLTVIGLGAMGTTIAKLYVQRGARVTLWNRSTAKTNELAAIGAHVAATIAAAIESSQITILCVANDVAARDILAAAGADRAIHGRTLIQLTTISPETARDEARWAHSHGASYLAGAIQAAPSQMGQADTPILVSGDPHTWERNRAVLELLGGGLVYLGDDPGGAAVMDLATLSWVYGAMLGFVHGATIAQAAHLDVARYGEIVRAISPSFGAFFQHEGRVIQSGDFAITESPLRISIDATARLLDSARATGLNIEFPAFVAGAFGRAARAGLGGEEVAALIKVMR
jgi:3-hydroxyisobutyrate dehydrogenase-like beta-hydroxyacid dehydrogenase